jgi:hypothetical protein
VTEARSAAMSRQTLGEHELALSLNRSLDIHASVAL